MGTNPRRLDGHSSNGRHGRNSDKGSRKTKQTANTALPSSNPNPSINALKSKIRALTRVLEHDDHLPPGVRIEKERALAGYKQDLEGVQEAKKKKALIGRYHMVRFFERRKATRNLNKAKRRLGAITANTHEHATALQDVHIAEVDLNYTLYSPLNAKYESIYRHELTNTDTGTERKSDKAETAPPSRPAIWEVVENCMRLGTLDALRDGKIAREVSMKPSKKHTKVSGGGDVVPDGSKSQPSKKKPQPDDKDDNDSDGGFFDE